MSTSHIVYRLIYKIMVTSIICLACLRSGRAIYLFFFFNLPSSDSPHYKKNRYCQQTANKEERVTLNLLHLISQHPNNTPNHPSLCHLLHLPPCAPHIIQLSNFLLQVFQAILYFFCPMGSKRKDFLIILLTAFLSECPFWCQHHFLIS